MPYVRIWVHLIWATKNREKTLAPQLQHELICHFKDYAQSKGIFLSEINCSTDHCHALVSLGASQTVSKVMLLLKGESSHWINSNNLVHGHFEWQDEYIAISVSESQVGKVQEYIRNQKEHHRQRTFSEEYDMFMNKYGFEIIDRSEGSGH